MSANSSFHHVLTVCLELRTTTFILTAILVTNLLFLLPLLSLVIYLGLQQWRQQRSTSTTMSHSDFFTYNMIALELISMFGSCFSSFGGNINALNLQVFGFSFFYFCSPAQSLIHLLACVDRYLAVVHPITYLTLRQAGAVRIRNVTTGCVWLLCLGFFALTPLASNTVFTATNSSIMVFCVLLVSFFSFSILYVLNHPGPGEVRQRVDQSKQRAFHTIIVIMVAELFRLVGVLVCSLMFGSSALTHLMCAVGSSAIFLALPCGLVLPVLFLQRAGKLPGCKHSGSG